MVVIIRIKKGRHFPSVWTWIRCVFLLWTKKELTITFLEASKYELDKGDQMDWNKVIGRGGLLWWNGYRKEEDYIVWRYDRHDNKFHLATNYQRRDWKMILPKEWIELNSFESYTFSSQHFRRLILPLGPYFGGNRVAPNEIKFILK